MYIHTHHGNIEYENGRIPVWARGHIIDRANNIKLVFLLSFFLCFFSWFVFLFKCLQLARPYHRSRLLPPSGTCVSIHHIYIYIYIIIIITIIIIIIMMVIMMMIIMIMQCPPLSGTCVSERTSPSTVSFYNFKSQNFKLSVSNPKSKHVADVSVLSQFSNCQSLGRKNKFEILKTDRIREDIAKYLLEIPLRGLPSQMRAFGE